MKFSSPNLLALGGGICFGIAFTIDKSVVIAQIHPAMYVGMVCLAVAVASFLFGARQIISETKQLVRSDVVPMLSSAVFGTLFNVFTMFAYANGCDVGKIDAMNNSAVFGVILMEMTLFKDRSDLWKKSVAALLAVAGIWLFLV